jgi:ABC-2 type transport system ATP-binding protein
MLRTPQTKSPSEVVVMSSVIRARAVRKSYGKGRVALDGIDFDIAPGRIVGLMGPKGAGKTTALKAILGLTPYDGELSVLGRNPQLERNALMQDVCFIADVAVLPKWMRVEHALEFVAGVHPRFDRERAEAVLAKTTIKRNSRIGQLSKGMITQLHLALIMAIDAKLLVLDEPTLGLDLLSRRAFYEALLNDYFDHERTILVTTHQVEEVENLLTDVLLIRDGRIVLDATVDSLATRYAQVTVPRDRAAEAMALGPFFSREVFGLSVFIYDIAKGAAPTIEQLSALGELRTPSIADLFVALLQPADTAPGSAV